MAKLDINKGTEDNTQVITETVQNIDNKELDILKKENESLKSTISSLTNKFEQFEKMLSQSQPQQNITSNSNNGKIRSDDYIKIVSLTIGSLSLRKSGSGHDAQFIRFAEFGKSADILFSDLSNIVHNHDTFAHSGKFYIYDDKAVQQLGLKESYKHILNKEEIVSLLDNPVEKIEEILKDVNEKQRKVIGQFIVTQVYNGKDVGAFKLDAIGNLCDVPINKQLGEYRDYMKKADEEEAANK